MCSQNNNIKQYEDYLVSDDCKTDNHDEASVAIRGESEKEQKRFNKGDELCLERCTKASYFDDDDGEYVTPPFEKNMKYVRVQTASWHLLIETMTNEQKIIPPRIQCILFALSLDSYLAPENGLFILQVLLHDLDMESIRVRGKLGKLYKEKSTEYDPCIGPLTEIVCCLSPARSDDDWEIRNLYDHVATLKITKEQELAGMKKKIRDLNIYLQAIDALTSRYNDVTNLWWFRCLPFNVV